MRQSQEQPPMIFESNQTQDDPDNMMHSECGMIWVGKLVVPGWWYTSIPTPLKNMNVNWDDYSQYMGK